MAVLQQGMLARLVLAAQNGELQGIEGIGGQGFGGGGGTIVVDENCQVRKFLTSLRITADSVADNVDTQYECHATVTVAKDQS